jgi:hypothetical protein
MNGIMRLYDIDDEYEIYSGNISSLTKGDSIHKKVKVFTIMYYYSKNTMLRISKRN